jgi:transcriptional regulator NrdR family protein
VGEPLRNVNLPGDGLKCDQCGGALPRVAHTRPTPGLIVRERRCPVCGHLNKTIERVIAGTAKRRFSDSCGE